MYYSAVYSSAVQCTAVQCSVVQGSAVQYNALKTLPLFHCSSLHCTAFYCIPLQFSIVLWSTLYWVQCSKVQCNSVGGSRREMRPIFNAWTWKTIWSTVRLRFRKSISGHNFQNTRIYAKNDFKYHRDVIDSVCIFLMFKILHYTYV